jgi:hypothetical protein
MATSPIVPEPAAKSRIAGNGATRVYAVPVIVGTTELSYALPAQHPESEIQPRPAPAEDDEAEVGEKRTEDGWSEAHRGVFYASTAPRQEFSPGIMYVRSRLLQMRERSKYEVAPYPDEFLLANAWYHAGDLLPPGTPAPSVVPSEDGNVSLVWHQAGWDVEIEIAYQDAEIWADHSSGESWSGSVWEDSDQLKELLRSLGAGD